MTTKQLRNKILDLAIHGRLVPQDPNDEPASVLLSRIHAEKKKLVDCGKLKKKDLATTPLIDDDKPFDVPEGWEWVCLKTIAFVGTGSTPSRNNKEYYGGNIPWISSSATSLDKITDPSDYITDKALKETNCQLYPIGTIIMAMYGEGKTRGQISELAIESCTNQACAAILPYDRELKKYIKLYLQSQYYHLRTLAEGGNQPNLNLGKISSYIIPLPPLAEQERIVAAVERWMSLIDVIESGQENLQQSIALAKNKILDLAIKGKLVENESEWEEKTLGEVFQHNTGKALNKSAGQEGKLLPYITTSNLYWDHFELENVKSMYFKDSEIEKCTVKKGDLLVCEGGDIGRSAIWDFDYDICIQNHIHRLRPIVDASPKFYYYVLMYYKMTDNIEGKGIGMMGLSSKQLDKIPIPLPPLTEQHRIVSKVEELFAQLDSIADALK